MKSSAGFTWLRGNWQDKQPLRVPERRRSELAALVHDLAVSACERQVGREDDVGHLSGDEWDAVIDRAYETMAEREPQISPMQPLQEQWK